jgi:hypothetical protein
MTRDHVGVLSICIGIAFGRAVVGCSSDDSLGEPLPGSPAGPDSSTTEAGAPDALDASVPDSGGDTSKDAKDAVADKQQLDAISEPSVDAAPEADAIAPAEVVTALTVRETAGIARAGEVVRSGVALPRSLGLKSTARLAVLDEKGVPVPSEHTVLGRWNAGLGDTAQPIQWVLVSFPASVAPNGAATYQLVLDDRPEVRPAHATPVQVTKSGDQVTVQTGAATFRMGGSPGRLFDEVRTAGGVAIVSGGDQQARARQQDLSLPTGRDVRVEHQGPLSAVVTVEGAYDLGPVGGGGLGSLVRYVFTAGSPTAIVRHVVKWEGDLCGNGVVACNGAPNGILVERVRDRLTVDAGAGLTVGALPTIEGPVAQASLGAGQSAHVRQKKRANRTAAFAYEAVLPGQTALTGASATGGILALSGDKGALALGLSRMDLYEPQALRVLDPTHLAIDLVDDSVWLANRQGLFAQMAVTALPGAPDRATLAEKLWGPLNRPLRAWPTAAWWRKTSALEEFPEGKLPDGFLDYDAHVESVLSTTQSKRTKLGLQGLLVTGLFPRYWEEGWGFEVDCTDATPGDGSDNAFWCPTWTDYHNTVSAVPTFALRSGKVEWLDELAVPAALRQLHTQVYQCAPNDDNFYCGQAPAGYGGYRADFNSSHAYFDNLFLYYWLTGDESVVATLRRGASSMRVFLCPKRPQADCAPTELPVDPWAQLQGRVASQWFAAFRFVGLASEDASYLTDWRTGLSRAVTQHYAQPVQAGVSYGFFGPRIQAAGTYETDQLWMVSLYDMNNLHRLMIDTGDQPIGEPAIEPSRVLASWARTLLVFGSGKQGTNPVGDGTAQGTWPNQLRFTFAGNRIGGTLTAVSPYQGGSDPNLYNSGKSTLTALLVRAAALSNDPAMRQMGRDLAVMAWQTSKDDLKTGHALGKVQGLNLARLHAAIGLLGATP